MLFIQLTLALTSGPSMSFAMKTSPHQVQAPAPVRRRFKDGTAALLRVLRGSSVPATYATMLAVKTEVGELVRRGSFEQAFSLAISFQPIKRAGYITVRKMYAEAELAHLRLEVAYRRLEDLARLESMTLTKEQAKALIRAQEFELDEILRHSQIYGRNEHYYLSLRKHLEYLFETEVIKPTCEEAGPNFRAALKQIGLFDHEVKDQVLWEDDQYAAIYKGFGVGEPARGLLLEDALKDVLSRRLEYFKDPKKNPDGGILARSKMIERRSETPVMNAIGTYMLLQELKRTGHHVAAFAPLQQALEFTRALNPKWSQVLDGGHGRPEAEALKGLSKFVSKVVERITRNQRRMQLEELFGDEAFELLYTSPEVNPMRRAQRDEATDTETQKSAVAAEECVAEFVRRLEQIASKSDSSGTDQENGVLYEYLARKFEFEPIWRRVVEIVKEGKHLQGRKKLVLALDDKRSKNKLPMIDGQNSPSMIQAAIEWSTVIGIYYGAQYLY